MGPIHFRDVIGGDTREYGTGFFAFSRDEEQRSAQLSELNQLRKQTVDQREKADKLKRRREDARAERLRKIKLRKEGGAGEGEGHDEADEADDISTFLAHMRQAAARGDE